MMEVDSTQRRSSVQSVHSVHSVVSATGQDTRAFYPQTQALQTDQGMIGTNDLMRSGVMYQNLKGLSPTKNQGVNLIQVASPRFSPAFGPHAVQRSVFVMDAKHTENQEIVELVPSPPYNAQLAPPVHLGGRISEIWNDDEKTILKDMESVMEATEQEQGDADAMMSDTKMTDKNPDVELKFRVKKESNIFSPDITHIEVTYPPRKSAEERASALLSRAFNPSLSPRLSQVSADFARRMRMSASPDGFGRMSGGMFGTDQFRLSLSPLPFEHFDPHQPPPPNAQFLAPLNPLNPQMHHPPPPMHMNFIQNPLHPHHPLQQVRHPPYGNEHFGAPPRVSVGRLMSPLENHIATKMSHRACARCHKVKKRCIRPQPGAPCTSCTKKRLFCESRKDGRSTNRGGGRKGKSVLTAM